MDENLLHISYESGILEDTKNKPKPDMFKLTKSPQEAYDKTTDIVIEFEKGIPIKVVNLTDKTEVKDSLSLFLYLNKLASENGIGRIDIVENRFVGMKSRGVYETPAGTILLKAHQDIESITLDKEVLYLKQFMVSIIGKLIYDGLWFSPEMDFLMAAINKSQENVTGRVYLSLYKGNVIVTGRESKYSLYNEALSSMEIEGGYDQKDAGGFIKITGLRLKLQGAKK
jgi:argininosuccinate synthase